MLGAVFPKTRFRMVLVNDDFNCPSSLLEGDSMVANASMAMLRKCGVDTISPVVGCSTAIAGSDFCDVRQASSDSSIFWSLLYADKSDSAHGSE